MHVSSSSYDMFYPPPHKPMQVTVAGWSVATGGLAGDHLSRPPGINVGPSDAELDQMAHSINAFSYARPVVHLVVPREGPVRRTRRITVDGANFGIQSRYIEVFVAGMYPPPHVTCMYHTLAFKAVTSRCSWQVLRRGSMRWGRRSSTAEAGKEAACSPRRAPCRLGAPTRSAALATGTAPAIILFVVLYCMYII